MIDTALDPLDNLLYSASSKQMLGPVHTYLLTPQLMYQYYHMLYNLNHRKLLYTHHTPLYLIYTS